MIWRGFMGVALAGLVAGCASVPQMSDWWPSGSSGANMFGGASGYAVRVETNPPGAAVSGGGKSCTAPCELSLEGPATLEMALSGFTTAVVDVAPPERMTGDSASALPRVINVDLEPAPVAQPTRPQRPQRPQSQQQRPRT
jgi:hypothetical protein